MAENCMKCFGSGWVWATELNQYDHENHNASMDQTRYSCDWCRGSGKSPKDAEAQET